jgi:hypothetical protein
MQKVFAAICSLYLRSYNGYIALFYINGISADRHPDNFSLKNKVIYASFNIICRQRVMTPKTSHPHYCLFLLYLYTNKGNNIEIPFYLPVNFFQYPGTQQYYFLTD